MEMWEKLPQTIGASTHTFKNCGCLSTHSTHTNGGPAHPTTIWETRVNAFEGSNEEFFHKIIHQNNYEVNKYSLMKYPVHNAPRQ